MKRISRLYGISLALCGLVCFSSCDKDDKNETETLAAPTGLTVSSITSNSVVLSWTSDAASFEVKVGNQVYTSSAKSYALDGLSPNTTYSWSVKAVKGDISSEWAAGSDFVTLEGISPPTGLTVSSITSTGAVLSWTSDATSFDIEVGSNTYTSYTANTNSYTLTGLESNTVYNWSVRAKNGTNISDWAAGSFTTEQESSGPAWNEFLATTSNTWWFVDGSSSVNTLVNTCATNINNEYGETLYAITLDEPPFGDQVPGRSITFVTTYGSNYYAGQFMYTFTPTGNNLALTYTGLGVDGEWYENLCSLFLDAINSKSPYSVTGDDFDNPTTVTFTSAADPNFWFTVERL
jgi:hypothetical protein